MASIQVTAGVLDQVMYSKGQLGNWGDPHVSLQKRLGRYRPRGKIPGPDLSVPADRESARKNETKEQTGYHGQKAKSEWS